MDWQDTPCLHSTLESCFTHIQQQMADVSMLNPALHVQAVGFQRFQQAWLGVLITPWFMNLMYFRDDNRLKGTKISHRFPAGKFEFTVGYEKELGFYQSCSLYSPIFEFEEQDIAVLTAQAVLDTLLKPPEQSAIARRNLL